MIRHKPVDLSDRGKQRIIDTSILEELVPAGFKLELNQRDRILSLLDTHSPCILAQQQFTRNEWKILLVLLASYPYYASNEALLASISSLSSVDCTRRLQEAQQLGQRVLKQELKPAYRALAGIRTKLSQFCPQPRISLVRGLGYALIASEETEGR